MHPASASADTFVVTVEVPDDTAGAGARRPVIVDGRVDVDGRRWTFIPAELDTIAISRWVGELGGSLRCRVALAGEVILDRAGVRPLDGEAVGRIAEDGYDNFIDLRLPSGNRNPGGDFKSWFYLTAPPSRVMVESVDPPADRLFPAGEGPAVILVSFSAPVRFATLDKRSLTVTRRHSADRGGRGKTIAGTIQPYPFESEPDLVTRVTFAPTDAEALRPMETAREGHYTFTIRVRGTGERPIVDVSNRAIDGARDTTASDFESSFRVQTREG